jgi:hypothetical protein
MEGVFITPEECDNMTDTCLYSHVFGDRTDVCRSPMQPEISTQDALFGEEVGTANHTTEVDVEVTPTVVANIELEQIPVEHTNK